MSGKFSVKTVFEAVDRITAPIRRMQANLGGLGKSAADAVKSASRGVDKVMGGLSRVSGAVGIAGVASVGGLGLALRQTISEGAEFERTMGFAAAQFPGLIRQGSKEFEALKAAAKAVGAATEFSAQQAAEGLTLLATAGLSAEQAVAALPKVVDFATASKVDFARASDIANDIMGSFSLTSVDAAKNAANMSRVMDVLTRAGADSTTNVTQLYDAITAGGNVAKTSGASLEEFAAMTGVLAKVGIKGAEAGTAIRNSFLELASPSTSAAKALAKLGVRVAKTREGAIDMTATIGRFAEATAKMTAAQKIDALGKVLGARTVGPFIALMDAGVGGIRKFQEGLENAKGTTESMAKAVQGDALGAFRQLDSLLAGVRLDVFDAIRPVVLDIIKATGAWVTANKDLIQTKAVEWISALRDNLPKIWEWTVRIGKAFAVFAVFAGTVKVLNTAILAYETAARLARGITWAWAAATKANTLASSASVAPIAAQTAALGPLLLTLGAATAAVAGLTAAWSQYNKLDKDLAGSGGISGTISKMWEMGTWNPFDAHDAVMNEKAREEREKKNLVARDLAAYKPPEIHTPTIALAEIKLPKIHAPILKEVGGAATEAAQRAAREATRRTALEAMKLYPELHSLRARDDEREPPQIHSPQDRSARKVAEETARALVAETRKANLIDGKITVQAAPGTRASVQAKPRSVPLTLQPTGAF